MTDRTVYLSRREASNYLKARGVPCAATTLSKMVTVGGGPPVCRFGRVPLYRPVDLDRWIEQRMRHESLGPVIA
jgi:hypothetical protein